LQSNKIHLITFASQQKYFLDKNWLLTQIYNKGGEKMNTAEFRTKIRLVEIKDGDSKGKNGVRGNTVRHTFETGRGKATTHSIPGVQGK